MGCDEAVHGTDKTSAGYRDWLNVLEKKGKKQRSRCEQVVVVVMLHGEKTNERRGSTLPFEHKSHLSSCRLGTDIVVPFFPLFHIFFIFTIVVLFHFPWHHRDGGSGCSRIR